MHEIWSVISQKSQNAFGGRAPHRPAGGAYSAPPDPLAGFKGPTSKGRGGEGRVGEGKGVQGRGGEARGGKGKRGEGAVPLRTKFLDTPLAGSIAAHT